MKGPTIEREWFSYPEAQRFTGLSRMTLWRLIGSGEVKAARVGRAVRLSRRSIEEYLERASGKDGREDAASEESSKEERSRA